MPKDVPFELIGSAVETDWKPVPFVHCPYVVCISFLRFIGCPKFIYICKIFTNNYDFS